MSISLTRFKSAVPLQGRFGNLHVVGRERSSNVLKRIGTCFLRPILCKVGAIAHWTI